MRSYTQDVELRVHIAKSLIFYSIGDIHLIYAYGTSSQFISIRTLVNKVLRATGLRFDVSQEILDKCLGCNLTRFARDAVLLNGFKILSKDTDYDRLSKIRSKFPPGSYLHFYSKLWNNLDLQTRKKYLQMELKTFKNNLKNSRKLKFYLNDHLRDLITHLSILDFLVLSWDYFSPDSNYVNKNSLSHSNQKL